LKKRKLEHSEIENEAEFTVSSLVDQISTKHLLPLKTRDEMKPNSKCPKCRKSYATPRSFRKHLQLFHRVATKDAEEYLKRFQSPNRKKPEKLVLECSIDADHTKKMCFICKKMFATDFQMKDHLTGFHKLVEINDNDPPRHVVEPWTPSSVITSPLSKTKKNLLQQNLDVTMCNQENDTVACPICRKVLLNLTI
jgi:hypothetical protein